MMAVNVQQNFLVIPPLNVTQWRGNICMPIMVCQSFWFILQLIWWLSWFFKDSQQNQ